MLGASRQRLRHAVGASPGRTGQLQPTGPAPERLPRPRWFVWFTPALGLLLGGYLFFSKSFAYLHVPGTPVFVGEIVLAIGMFEALQLPSPWRHLLSRAPVLKAVLVFLAICGVRLFFDYPAYGLDAARDAAIAYYGLFALLTAAAVVCEPTFVPRLLGWYRRLLPAFLVWAPVAILLSDVDALSGIVVPGTDTPINSFKVGDFGVQIAMAVAFLWLDGTQARSGPTRRSPSRTTTLSLVGLVGLFVCLTQNRGGFLAGAVTLCVAAVYLPPGRRRRLALPLVSGLAVITLFIALLNVRIPISEREISLQQVTSNITSIVHRQSSQQLRGTVEWREQLWQRLRADMLATGAWRTGLGFGPVLGTRYGVSDPSDPRPLRNIHNSHLTVFARTGAVGLAVWTLLWLIWCVYLHRWIRRRPGGVRDPRGATAGWLLAGAVGLLVNAYFDPSLEGPQACIWLYVILGIGAATTRSPRSPRQPALASAGPAGQGERPGGGAGPAPWHATTERANGRPADPAERDAPAAGADRWRIARMAEQGRRLQGVARRLGWAVADQALSSLTNFLVGFFVARSLGPTAFGAFSVAFATYLIALNGSRGLATDPLMVRYSGVQLTEWRRAVAGSTGTAAAVGTLGGIVCAALAIVVPGPTGLALLALGLSMPGLLLQDSWRFAFFSAGTAGRAFANDLVRAVVLLVLIAAVIASGRSSEFFFMLAWGISATIAAVAGAVQARLLPRALLAADWLRRHRDLCSRYLAENLSVTGGTQLKFYGLAAVGGIAVVGTLRAAELLFGGVYVLTQGIGLMAVPEAVRLLRQSGARLRQFCLLISALGGGAGIVCGAVLLAIPESLGQRLLHESWAPASTVLLPTTVFITAFGLQMGAWAGLRALAAASRSLLSQLVGSVLSVAGVLAGAAAAGAIGAAWGIAAAGVVAATFWWWQFHVGLQKFGQAEPET